MDPAEYKDAKNPQVKAYPMSTYSGRNSDDITRPYRDETPPRPWGRRESSENLVSSAASLGHHHQRSSSRESEGVSPPPMARQPTVPNMIDYRGRAY